MLTINIKLIFTSNSFFCWFWSGFYAS